MYEKKITSAVALDAASFRHAVAEPIAGLASLFTPVELTVIHIGAGDGASTLLKPTRLSRALRFLFGSGPRTKLADPRLEALRRTAVLLNTRRRLASSDYEGFAQAGYSDAQLALLRFLLS